MNFLEDSGVYLKYNYAAVAKKSSGICLEDNKDSNIYLFTCRGQMNKCYYLINVIELKCNFVNE